MKNEIKIWIENAAKAVEKNTKAEFPTCELNWSTLRFTKGRKYIKVFIDSLEGGKPSVYCFIDMDGNIYKAATWQQPSKGIRGHVDTTDTSKLSSSTHWLYR